MTSKQPRMVVLTGAGRGLGRALARELTRLGHRVHTAVRHDRDDGLRAQLAVTGGTLGVVDVTDAKAVNLWAENVLNQGVPDLVINNAGVIHPNNVLEDITPEEVAGVLAANVVGVVNVCRAFVPALKLRGQGVIANLSSGAGRQGFAGISVYCASKFAVEGLTQALAAELPEGMAAVAVSPGIIDTDMLRMTWGAEAGKYPGPEVWARSAAPFFLGLNTSSNGLSVTTPEL